MTSGTEGLIHGLLSTHSNKRTAPHISGHEYRLPCLLVAPGNILMTRWESSGSSFAVNANLKLATIYRMFFYFGYIMGNIINLSHAQFLGTLTENFGKAFSSPVGNTLPVNPSIVSSTCHGS